MNLKEFEIVYKHIPEKIKSLPLKEVKELINKILELK